MCRPLTLTSATPISFSQSLLVKENTHPFEQIAGIDEAGRGSLAGPVIAAAVVLHPDRIIDGLRDSKKLSPQRRRHLLGEITSKAVFWSIGRASAAEIDRLNIHHATLLAMTRAWEAIPFQVEQVLVDGLHCPELAASCRAIVKGDQSVPVISAASILAKVTRDEEMLSCHTAYPQYGFDQHKGYPTAGHLAALRDHGPSDLHRKSYGPVRDAQQVQQERVKRWSSSPNPYRKSAAVT